MRRPLLAAAVSGALALLGGIAAAQTSAPMDHDAMHGHGMDHGAVAGQGGPAEANAPDARLLVAFPPALAERTLANMRDHVGALQEITAALARGENGAAGRIAEERLGMSSLDRHEAHEAARYMPPGMQEAGGQMHHAASRFAIAAQNADVTGDPKPALAALSAVMEACVACHAGFRLR